MQHAGMRSQTRQDGRSRVALRPIEDLREQVPVRFFSEVRIARFRPGNNHSVKLALPQVVKREIKVVQVPLAAIRAWNARKRVQLDKNWKIFRRAVEKLEKLQLGIFEGGI